MYTVGFVINPIAGMGGRVGFKGTDGLYEEALRRGAKEVAEDRAKKFLKEIDGEKITFLTASGKMGELVLKDFNFKYRVVYHAPEITSAQDTKNTCLKFMNLGAELIIFVGGDGTARDVVEVVDSKVPILGVPSGVKMYSSIFCVKPSKCGEIVKKFLRNEVKFKDAEVLDINEEAYRNNRLEIKLYGFAKVPYIQDYVQNSKSEYYGEEEEEDKDAIAEFFAENVEKDMLYILGAGTTVKKIADKMKVEKTLLGVDAYYNGKVVGRDLDEKGILNILEKYPRAKLVITPIGSQGFVFGRGNQQISEKVLKRIGRENIIIVATPSKIRDIDKLRFDLDNCEFLKGYYKVLVGYGRYKVLKME